MRGGGGGVVGEDGASVPTTGVEPHTVPHETKESVSELSVISLSHSIKDSLLISV